MAQVGATNQYAVYAKQLYRLLIRTSSFTYQSNAVAERWVLGQIRSEFRKHRNESSPAHIESLLRRAHLVLVAIAPSEESLETEAHA